MGDKEEEKEVSYIDELIIEGLMTDGEHHKQWYLEQVLLRLGIDVTELGHEPGVAP